MPIIWGITIGFLVCVAFLKFAGDFNNAVKPLEVQEKEQMVKLLPQSHTNLKRLGNQWFSYDLEADGKSRAFLARYWVGYSGEVGITVIELL